MKKKSHFSVEDILMHEFKKPVSRGNIGKDANGLLWAYGVVMEDSRYSVEVVTIDLETYVVKRQQDKESSYGQRAHASAYVSGLIKELPSVPIPTVQ